MQKPKTPCYGCADRTVTCHGGCGRYKAFREQLDAYNEKNRNIWFNWTNMRKPRKNEKRLSAWEEG